MGHVILHALPYCILHICLDAKSSASRVFTAEAEDFMLNVHYPLSIVNCALQLCWLLQSEATKRIVHC